MSYLQMLRSAERGGGSDAPSRGVGARGEENRQTEFEIDEAMRLLNLAGVRIMRIGADLQIGVWQDVDAVEIRAAIRAVGLDVYPVVYLRHRRRSDRFKERRTPDRAKGESFSGVVEAGRTGTPMSQSSFTSVRTARALSKNFLNTTPRI